MREMLIELYECLGLRVHEEVLRFSSRVQEFYPEDARHCALFLLIIGGTLPEHCKRFDFGGEHSIARFISGLHRTNIRASSVA